MYPKDYYSNSAAVPGSDALLGLFQANGRAVYEASTVETGLAYGPTPRETLDWFFPAQSNGNVVVFIHGGYWQACEKEDFAFIAQGPLQQGYEVVLVEYTLAPEASLTRICQEIGRALDFVQQRLVARGHTGNVFLTGHSAGGHLTAHWQGHPVVSGSAPISGIFELEPITHTEFNEKLHLTGQEIATLSPARKAPAAHKPMVVVYGVDERPELVEQSQVYHTHATAHKCAATLVGVPATNHFTVLEEVFKPGGAVLAFFAAHK